MSFRRELLFLCVVASLSLLTTLPIARAAEEISVQFSEHPPERGLLQPKIFTEFPALPKLPYSVDRHLSLLITDVDIVKGIRFSAVMNAVIDSYHSAGGNPAETKETLFHQLWDSENQGPGLIEPVATPHCDDESKPGGNSIGAMNGFSFRCPRYEGDLADGFTGKYNAGNTSSPFSDDASGGAFDDSTPYDAKNVSKNSFSAIAVSNRFDLLSPAVSAPKGKVRYPDCGEVRIIFARNAGVSVGQNDGTIILGDKFERNLIAFEARVPNPDSAPQEANGFPSGCVALLQFFRGLSDPALTDGIRSNLLTALILEGKIQRYENNAYILVSRLSRPVVDFRNFLQNAGQIRTDQFLNKLIKVAHPPPPPPSIYDPPGKTTFTDEEVPQDWTLREFRLQQKGGNLIALPDTVKSSVGRELLAATNPAANLDKTRALLKDVTDQLGRLAGGTDKTGAYSNGGNVGLIAFPTLSRIATAFESDSSAQDRGDIVSGYNGGLANAPTFNTPIADDLAGLNSKLKGGTLTVANVIDRVRTQTCAGCHQYSDTKTTTPAGDFGFDPAGALGLGAVWPNKACGDIDKKNCALPAAVLDVSGGAGKATKDTLMPTQHPPMQFTMISELILTRSVGDHNNGWRYAISTTVECLLNAREDFFRTILHDPANPSPAPCAP